MTIFRFTSSPRDLHQETEISPDECLWDHFEQALRDEPSLFQYPLPIFKERLAENKSIIVINNDNEVVSTISLIPKLTENIRAITKILEDTQIYELATGWTHAPLRGTPIQQNIRSEILKNATENDICFSQNYGKGAALLNIKRGWKIAPWDEYPFVSSLFGWPQDDSSTFRLSAGLHIPVKELFNEPKINNLKAHPWSKYHHLWTSDFQKTAETEHHIKTALSSDLDAWRVFIATELHCGCPVSTDIETSANLWDEEMLKKGRALYDRVENSPPIP